MDEIFNSIKHKRLCLHEAGHFVFALLLNKIDGYYEEISEISVDEDKGWYRVHFIPGKGNNPRSFYGNYNELIKIRSLHAVGDIILQLSGSATHIAYLGSEDPNYPIIQLNQYHQSLIHNGDFYNARLIGHEFFRMLDNEEFYLFAKDIQEIIVDIMNQRLIKEAIYTVAENIAKRRTIDHTEMNDFESLVEGLIREYDIALHFQEIINKYRLYHPISKVKKELHLLG